MTKDWTGNKKTTFSVLGASNHSEHERAKHDFYATSPEAIDGLLQHEEFSPNIWECAAGNGHLSKKLIEYGFNVYSSDIVKRDFECDIFDFLLEEKKFDGDIITNPPYRFSQEFIENSLKSINEGNKVAMFLKLTFLEGIKRKKLFEKYPPKKVCVFSKRIQAALNGDLEMFKKSSAACYAWFIWQKGNKDKPTIEWI